MHAHKRAGALPIQIKIPDVKLLARALQLRFVSAVNGARQTKLRVVRDLQRIVIILRLDHGEHWAKNLFLLDRVAWLHVGDYSRFDEEPLFAVRSAAGNYTSAFTLSL